MKSTLNFLFGTRLLFTEHKCFVFIQKLSQEREQHNLDLGDQGEIFDLAKELDLAPEFQAPVYQNVHFQTPRFEVFAHLRHLWNGMTCVDAFNYCFKKEDCWGTSCQKHTYKAVLGKYEHLYLYYKADNSQAFHEGSC